jgi:hypothetical protein
MSDHLIKIADLARTLNVPADELMRIGLEERLPLSWVTGLGNVVIMPDVSRWRATVRRVQQRACCE